MALGTKVQEAIKKQARFELELKKTREDSLKKSEDKYKGELLRLQAELSNIKKAYLEQKERIQSSG